MFPVSGLSALFVAVGFGIVFGFLLHRGRVADYNTIVNQFLFRDMTVIKIMMTAIIVGGVGVLIMKDAGLVKWHVKDANLLAVGLGAAIFGVGMVVLGYCPGTALAAIGGGSLHAVVGGVGMLAGAVAYAYSFDWVKATIIPVWQFGKMRLPDLLGIGAWPIFGVLTVAAIALFALIERHDNQMNSGF